MSGVLNRQQQFRVFIGYDRREPLAYHVAAHSILRRASIPISITPLAITSLRGIYHRERGPTESTEFALTRFLVPYLSDYEGWSLFLDSDMLVQCDLLDLQLEMLSKNRDKAILVCPHEYTPRPDPKFLGQVQTAYPRKNWSSFMVFHNKLCRRLTPEYVNTASGLELHRFQWLRDEQIGQLPLEWNWLVGEYPLNPDARVLHYTRGGPWFGIDGDHAQDWLDERKNMEGAPVEVLA